MKWNPQDVAAVLLVGLLYVFFVGVLTLRGLGVEAAKPENAEIVATILGLIIGGVVAWMGSGRN